MQNYEGLTDQQVSESRLHHGGNTIDMPASVPWWRKLALKFTDPLIVILLVAGALSVAISFYDYFSLSQPRSVFFEPVGIFAAIGLATGLAFLFEWRADREFSLLNQVRDDEPVAVFRNGQVVRVPRREIVVGDVVCIETGGEIPADGILLDAVRLQIDESTLTGEPVCQKTIIETEFDSDATFPSNRVLRGTKVMEGHGVMMVDAVGNKTENGKVYRAAQIENNVRTPLNEQLDRLGKLISQFSYAIAVLVIVGRLSFYLLTQPFETIGFVAYVLQTVMVAVTLIVVAVPEGLPMAVTLSLAYSMRRMLKTNNLVRRMHACETMGAATVICTDKTGTLTQNHMQVSEWFFLHNYSAPLLHEAIAVNSTARLSGNKVIGNPTEGALLLWLRSQQIDEITIRHRVHVLEEVPFNTEQKYMQTTVCSSVLDGQRVTYLKGGPEIVMSFCRLTPEDRSRLDAQLNQLQAKAMRTLAFAFRVESDSETASVNEPDTLLFTFQALVAISDPVRPEVPAAVAECQHAGIEVKIVTGDTIGTAMEIARQIGLPHPTAVLGTEVGALTDVELSQRINEVNVIARARPMDKKRVVEALQRSGQVVAVTGDGTNDAPALKAAHVGLSMGDGTSVAKDSSDITIVNNSFSSICRAVLWGRSLYKNIQRFILFQTTVNVCACLVVLVGAFTDTQSPLTVTQMLWVNLIMDTFAAMAFASLPPSHRVMREPPRERSAFVISKEMWWFVLCKGGLFFVLLTGLYWLFEISSVNHSLFEICTKSFGQRNGLSPYELSLFFTTFVMLQFWNMFNVRRFSGGASVRLSDSKGFLLVAAMVLFGQLLIVQLGGSMFNVIPLSFSDWLLVIVFTALVNLLI